MQDDPLHKNESNDLDIEMMNDNSDNKAIAAEQLLEKLSKNKKEGLSKNPKFTPKITTNKKDTNSSIVMEVASTNQVNQSSFKQLKWENEKLKEEIEELKKLLTNLQGFKEVKKRKSSTQTQNRYAILDQQEDNEINVSVESVEEETPSKRGRVQKTDHNQILQKIKEKNDAKSGGQIGTTAKNSRKEPTLIRGVRDDIQPNTINDNNEHMKKTKEKIPPIVIYNQDISDTTSIMKNIIKSNDFTLTRINASKHLLKIGNLDMYNKAIKTLEEASTKYFTFTPKSEKLQTYLLKGLDPNSSIDEIQEGLKNSLEKLGIDEVTIAKITPFKTKRSRIEMKPLPMFLIQFTADSNCGKIRLVKHVLFQSVRWEKLRRQEIIQCKNCQRIGHVAFNCKLDYRCVKCNENHSPGQCKIKETETVNREKLYCYTCQKYGHPASYRGCPKLIEQKNIRQMQVLKNKASIQKKQTSFKNIVQPNVSYSSKLKTSLINSFSTHKNPENEFQKNEERAQNESFMHNELNSFKNEMMQFIKEQIALIGKDVALNTVRINSVCDLLHSRGI